MGKILKAVRRMDPKKRKNELRSVFAGRRKSLGPAFRKNADKAICEKLIELEDIKNSEMICSYISDGTEPSLNDFILKAREKGKRLCFPRHGKDSEGKIFYELAEPENYPEGLITGAYGIAEPAPDAQIIEAEKIKNLTWLVPGVAFDTSGARLGRGKAVYDGLLKDAAGLKIGIFYECQQCASIPLEEHDLKMDLIVTEERVYRCALKKESKI
jgi:5-formyltetrahydrofolate cyclo-ligase